MRLLGCVVASLLVLAGCSGTDDDDHELPHDAALTPRAVAAVMLDHLPDDTDRREASPRDERNPEGYVGAQLHYPDGAFGVNWGTFVETGVDTAPLSTCENGTTKDDNPCVELDDGDLLVWQEEEPEEDPGIVIVMHRAGGDRVTTTLSGPLVTGDPRDLDFKPTLDTIVDLTRDPRLRLQTAPDIVAAGEDLDDWSGQ